MNKLLLLASSLICLTLQGYPKSAPVRKELFKIQAVFNDSIIKQMATADPKDAFKDLFTLEANNGSSIFRLNPKAISFVQDYMEVHGERLNRMKDWGRPYFDMMSTVLEKYHLPAELKYLSVIESDLKSTALSWAGAVGPWQFMAQTARDLGLKVNRKVDERRDYVKSTHAAARYLNELHNLFNDWLLVIAAYNCGPAGVYSAIRKSGSRNFWDLQYYLPTESRNHVKKFIATHYIMEGDAGLTTMTRSETENLFLSNQNSLKDSSVTVINITGKYNAAAIAQGIQMDLRDFNRLNPNMDRMLSANGSYNLRIPNEKLALFQANKPMILEQSIKAMLALTN